MKIDLDEIERVLDRYPDKIYATVHIEIQRFGSEYAPKITFKGYISRTFEEGRMSEELYELNDALRFIEETYERYYRI
jgi:hypothetical protein